MSNPDTTSSQQMDPQPQSITVKQSQKVNEIQNKVGDYILSKGIGSGAFGKVYLGIHLLTGQKVAVKVVEKQRITSKLIDRVKREIKNLCKLHHPCIVQLYELIEKQKHIYLIMEYVAEGELFNYIVKSKKLEEKEACQFFQQLIAGIQYFHKCGIAHRDLKPENILIDKNKRIKIIDFGLSNTYEKNERLHTACGSPCYLAPQMIETKCQYSPLQVDIWSAGVILYAMVCGCLPFMDANPRKIYEKIKAGLFKVPKTLSLQVKTLIARMLSVDPSKRISIAEIRAHRWWQMSQEARLYGIIQNYHQYPIDQRVLCNLKSYDMDVKKVEIALKRNLHVPETATYYLLLKKSYLQGNHSEYYIGSSDFNPMLLELQNLHFQDVDTAQIPSYLPPNQSETESIKPGDDTSTFQVFLPWQQLYYRIAQLTQARNNIFLKALLQKGKKQKSKKRPNLRYHSRQKRNFTSSIEKDRSLNLPRLNDKISSKNSPDHYSGYFGNVSRKNLSKLQKISMNEQQKQKQSFQKTKVSKKKQHSHSIEQTNVRQVLKMLEHLHMDKIQESPDKMREDQQSLLLEPQTQQKMPKLSLRYRMSNPTRK